MPDEQLMLASVDQYEKPISSKRFGSTHVFVWIHTATAVHMLFMQGMWTGSDYLTADRVPVCLEG